MCQPRRVIRQARSATRGSGAWWARAAPFSRRAMRRPRLPAAIGTAPALATSCRQAGGSSSSSGSAHEATGCRSLLILATTASATTDVPTAEGSSRWFLRS